MLNVWVDLFLNKHDISARLGLFFLCAILSTSALSQTATVRIRVLDGHNGQPIVQRGVVIARYEPLVPHVPPSIATTDARGVVTITAPVHIGLNAITDQYPTCRYVPKADRTKGPITFPVDQIVATGVVEKNNCSHLTASPTTGELTLFVRPLHWWERLSD